MNTFLRVSALFVAIITIALWFFGGYNLGRTRLFVPVEHPGENGQPLVRHETRFLPGIDFLAGGLALGLGLVVASGCIRPSGRVAESGS